MFSSRRINERRATYRDAVANAERVIEEWIETAKESGRKISVPRGRLRDAREPRPPAQLCPHGI
jgi:predicted RNase H-like HicB family nuclease